MVQLADFFYSDVPDRWLGARSARNYYNRLQQGMLITADNVRSAARSLKRLWSNAFAGTCVGDWSSHHAQSIVAGIANVQVKWFQRRTCTCSC